MISRRALLSTGLPSRASASCAVSDVKTAKPASRKTASRKRNCVASSSMSRISGIRNSVQSKRRTIALWLGSREPEFQGLSTLLMIITGENLAFRDQPVFILLTRRTAALLIQFIGTTADFGSRSMEKEPCFTSGEVTTGMVATSALRALPLRGDFALAIIWILLTDTKVQ